jgi:hypothetical protein
MFIRKFTSIIFVLLLLLAKGIGQTTTTISYASSGLNSSSCNVFNLASPAIIGGCTHLPTAGGAGYDGTNYIMLDATYGTGTSSNYGTIYDIKYAFKKGHTYTVKVSGKSSAGNVQVNAALNTQNYNTGTNTNCGQVAQSNWTTVATNIYSYVWLTTTPTQYPMSAITPTNNFDYLSIIVTGVTAGTPVTAYISQIVIVDVAPAVTSFSVSPASVIKNCGTSNNQTFTITGVNVPGGSSVTYSWDLGSSSSGWYYGGSPAPQNISTGSSNTLTLTDISCAVAPTNITAKATISSTDYPAGTVNVTSAPFTINGPSFVCSGTTSTSYSITNLGCSPSVSWSFAPSGLVSVDNPSSATTTLTYSGSGNGTLTATYSSACGSGTLSIPVTVGSPVPKGISNYFTNYGSGNSPSLVSQYAFLGTNHSQPGDNNGSFNYYVNDPLFSGLTWSVVSQPSGTNYQLNGNTTWMYVVMNGCTNCSLGITMNLSGTGPCGTYSQNITSTCARISGYGFRAAIFPNPATSSATVSLAAIEDNTVSAAESAQKSTAPKPLIRAIQIASQMGAIIKTFEYKAGVASINVPLSGITSGIYQLSVFDGTNWTSQQLIIK